MATYIGNYLDNFGNEYLFKEIVVNYVVESSLGTTRGINSTTNSDFDNFYLPQIFKDNFRLKTIQDSRTCPFDFVPRFAKLYLTQSEYLKIQIPFKPNTTEFNQFFIDLYFGNISEVISIGYIGEKLNFRRLNYANKA